MCTLAGPDASVEFTHLSSAAGAALSNALPPAPARASCHEEGVLALMQSRGIALERVCLLDPKAPEALSPSDGESSADGFSWFLFGVRAPFISPLRFLLTRCAGYTWYGVICVIVIFMLMLMLDLGDDPPRDRTAELRVLGFPRRHLGSVQMTTDTALGVTKCVVEDRGSCLESPPTGQETDRFVCAVTVPLEQIPYVVRSPDPVPSKVVKLPLPGLPDDPLQCARKRRNALPCVATILPHY